MANVIRRAAAALVETEVGFYSIMAVVTLSAAAAAGMNAAGHVIDGIRADRKEARGAPSPSDPGAQPQGLSKKNRSANRGSILFFADRGRVNPYPKIGIRY